MGLHILSLMPLPGLQQAVEARVPGAVVTVAEQGKVPKGLAPVDCLLTAVVGVDGLEHALSTYPTIDWVHVFGTGVDNFPIDCVGDRQLTCSRGASAVPIAEWVMAMMLAVEKQLPDVWIHEPPTDWHRSFSLSSLAGKQLGLVGFGGIGRAIAQRANAFDMDVFALTRSSTITSPGVRQVGDINELVGIADHLVLAAPATEATARLMNAAVLASMKEGSHLVNIARGSLVDNDSLKYALDNGPVAFASLDAVEPEPLPEGHWLYSHPKVRLSPHVSWSEPHAFETLVSLFLDNLVAYAAGGTLAGSVDKAAGY